MSGAPWQVYDRPIPEGAGASLDKLFGSGLEFEIAFFEPILDAAPDFVDVLRLLGNAYTRKGLYQKGLEVDRKLTILLPADSIAHYNLACSLALLGQKEPAYESLEKAITLGYRDAETMEKDEDLKSLREEPRFQGLLATLRKK